MAKGRLFTIALQEEMQSLGYSKPLCYELLCIHIHSDDEGYIKRKVALAEADCSEESLNILKKDGFIGMNEKVLKVFNWLRYQTIRSDRYTPSVLKRHWHDDMTREDAVPLANKNVKKNKKKFQKK